MKSHSVSVIVACMWMIAVSTISAGPSFAQPASAPSNEIIVSWQPGIVGTGQQRLLNVSVQIENVGSVAENFTITLKWEALIPVATRNVTNFASGAIQWFTLAALVDFDPTISHYVGVAAGDAWLATPIYRPPTWGFESRPWWDDYAYLFIGLGIAIGLATTLWVGRTIVTGKRRTSNPAAGITAFLNTKSSSL